MFELIDLIAQAEPAQRLGDGTILRALWNFLLGVVTGGMAGLAAGWILRKRIGRDL